jgi:glycerol-3-phosphate acyltransferase PlsY
MTSFKRKETTMNLNEGLLAHLLNNNLVNVDFFPILYALLIVGVILISYLLGSINTAIIISKLLYKDDIRRHGSGNAGMTNMLRTYGKGAAGLTLVGDLMKTVISIFVAAIFFGFNYVGGISTGEGVCYIAGLFVVVGHVFPIYYKFKGGKGVLATASMALILSPVPFLILFAIFALIVGTSKYVSLGSVTVAVLYPVVLNAYFKFRFAGIESALPGYAALSSILLAILIVWCHRGNLARISNRTERKISFGKKPKEPEANDEDEDEE